MTTTPPAPVLPGGVVAPLRDDLEASGWTVDGVEELLGPVAEAALRRESLVPALRVTEAPAAAGDPAAVLTRLFLLGRPVPRAALDRALRPPAPRARRRPVWSAPRAQRPTTRSAPRSTCAPTAPRAAPPAPAARSPVGGFRPRRSPSPVRRCPSSTSSASAGPRPPGPPRGPRARGARARHRHGQRGPGAARLAPRALGDRHGHLPALPGLRRLQRGARRGGSSTCAAGACWSRGR